MQFPHLTKFSYILTLIFNRFIFPEKEIDRIFSGLNRFFRHEFWSLCGLQIFEKKMRSRLHFLSVFSIQWSPKICFCSQNLWCQQCRKTTSGKSPLYHAHNYKLNSRYIYYFLILVLDLSSNGNGEWLLSLPDITIPSLFKGTLFISNF